MISKTMLSFQVLIKCSKLTWNIDSLQHEKIYGGSNEIIYTVELIGRINAAVLQSSMISVRALTSHLPS